MLRAFPYRIQRMSQRFLASVCFLRILLNSTEIVFSRVQLCIQIRSRPTFSDWILSITSRKWDALSTIHVTELVAMFDSPVPCHVNLPKSIFHIWTGSIFHRFIHQRDQDQSVYSVHSASQAVVHICILSAQIDISFCESESCDQQGEVLCDYVSENELGLRYTKMFKHL